MHPSDQEHETERLEAERQKEVAAYGRAIASAIAQARRDVATELKSQQKDWTPEHHELFAEFLKPFEPDQIYSTVHEAVTRTLRDAAPCVLAKFPTERRFGRVVAPLAAAEAVRRVRDAGFKAQCRIDAVVGGLMDGKYSTYQVKLLDT